MGTRNRPVWGLLCLIAALGLSNGIELKPAASQFISSEGADGWLPMVRPAGLSSAAASVMAAAAAAAAVSADPTEDPVEGRQRALQHPVMGRIQQHLSATPKRLLRPTFDGFLGGSNKVEVFAPPPASLLTTFGQAGIRKPPPIMTAQESRFAAFEQSAPSIFFVQPPPAPSNPSVFTLPPHRHHGSFPIFPAQQQTFFRSQPQNEFRFIPEQSSFSGLTHSFIPPVDRSKQSNRYLPSVGQSFEIHPSRQPLIRPLVPSPQYNENPPTSLAPITFPPQRSSPAPFKPFPEQRLPFLPNDAQQQIQQQQIQQSQFQQPQFQQPQQFQHQTFQQFPQPQIQQPQVQQSQDNEPHLQQRPIEKLRITRPYFEETRPTVSNLNYGPQTFPTPHAFADFPPTSFFFPEPTQTEPPTTSTTQAPEPTLSSVPQPHVNEVQPTSEQQTETVPPPKRKIPHHRRRKPHRQTTTTTTTPLPEVNRDDDFGTTPPPSVLPEAVHQYQPEVPLPSSDPTFETFGTYQPPSIEPTQFQEQSVAEPVPTLSQLPEQSFINHENTERISTVPSTEAPVFNEEPPATARPRRKKPTDIRHRTVQDATTTPSTPLEYHNHQLQDVPITTIAPQTEPTDSPLPSSSTTPTLSSRLRPRIRFNSTRPSFSLKEYRGRLNKPTPSETTETSSSSPAPSAIPPRIRYPSRVRSPYRPSTTDEPSTGNELNRTKSRFNHRYRTSTTTSAPDTVSSPTETSETKSFHFKSNMTRFRPGSGKYVSRFRLTSTTETSITEKSSRLPSRTTGVYSVKRPAPTEAAEIAPAPFTPETPVENERNQPAESEDLESHPSNRPFSELTPESRLTTSSEIPIESSPEIPIESSPETPVKSPEDESSSSSKLSIEIPDVTAEAVSVPPPDIHIDSSSDVPSEETPILSETPSTLIPTPAPKPTGTALEQDNEILPPPSGSEPSEPQTESSPDDMMLSPSSRVADLTSSPNNKYDNPQIRLKSAIPPRISLSTDDPILPIEAFFNSWNKGGKSS